eukprot:6367698-Lingulodinium_polyedra.AAC.1
MGAAWPRCFETAGTPRNPRIRNLAKRPRGALSGPRGIGGAHRRRAPPQGSPLGHFPTRRRQRQ